MRAFDLIVFICQRAADKISGGRSPNDQAFESFHRVSQEPHVTGVSEVSAKRIQTAFWTRFLSRSGLGGKDLTCKTRSGAG